MEAAETAGTDEPDSKAAAREKKKAEKAEKAAAREKAKARDHLKEWLGSFGRADWADAVREAGCATPEAIGALDDSALALLCEALSDALPDAAKKIPLRQFEHEATKLRPTAEGDAARSEARGGKRKKKKKRRAGGGGGGDNDDADEDEDADAGPAPRAPARAAANSTASEDGGRCRRAT